MSDFFDKALLLGAGLEKKLKELACELDPTDKDCKTDNKGETKEGSEGSTAATDRLGATDGLGAKERIENRLVTEGVRGIKELVSLIKDGKDKVDGEVSGIADTIADRMGLATTSELTTVKEMARVARERADNAEASLKKTEARLEKLEKRIKELEKED